MENAIRNAVIPFHWDYIQKRMDSCPTGNSQQNVIGVLTAIEHIHVVKVEIYDMDLRMVLPEVISELIHIMAPSPVHQHEIFAIKICDL